ncbi:MAG: hypothetical protein H6Q00_616 [Holophagaceae bacterium]|nr:hypothetical protein [Holophagaceae bacterium]
MKALAFALCVPSLVMAQSRIQPPWVNLLPSAPGRVYAVGLAPVAPTEGQAVRQASQNARVEVISRLRASVKGDTHLSTHAVVQRQGGSPASGSSTQTLSQDSTIQTQAVELPGLVVEETWVDRKGDTAYALAYLDVPAAEKELRNRFEAMKHDLAIEEGTSGGPRERLKRLQTLKSAQTEMDKLDDMAGLISAGGADPALRRGVRDLKLAVDRLLDRLRNSLTMCVGGDKDLGMGGDVATLVRNAVLKQGLGWAESNAEFTLNLRFQGNRQAWDIRKRRWWEYDHSADFIVARGILEITLADRAGTQYESTVIEAKGVGVSEFQADQRLLKDYKAKLESTLGQWLAELVN